MIFRVFSAIFVRLRVGGADQNRTEKSDVPAPVLGFTPSKSKLTFPQKTGSTPSGSFELFGWQQNATQEVTKSDSLIHKSVAAAATDLSISLVQSVSGFQATFCGTLSA